jgi:hypothetical protein
MSKAGLPYEAFRAARANDTVAMSQGVFDEVSDVLHRPRLARFVDPDLRADLLDQLISATAWFEPSATVQDCRDAKDDKYLDLALASQATIIVSSDQDLLAMDPWRGVRILRPAEYVNPNA